MSKVITRWKNVGLNVIDKQINSLDCFEFDDRTYVYDATTLTNEEAEKKNKNKKRYTLTELNGVWKNTPMAKCARRELKPNWEFKNVKCSCGTDSAGGGLHQEYCDKSKFD